MLINTQSKTSENLTKPINFENMMRHQFNEVIFRRGGFVRHQVISHDSRCYIMRPLNLKFVPFIEKVNTLFYQAESQHFNSEMLAFFFYPTLKEKQL